MNNIFRGIMERMDQSDYKPKVKCVKCDQEKIVRIVYGMPMDESMFEAADKGKIILGGCSPTDNKYGCTNCGAEYESKP